MGAGYAVGVERAHRVLVDGTGHEVAVGVRRGGEVALVQPLPAGVVDKLGVELVAGHAGDGGPVELDGVAECDCGQLRRGERGCGRRGGWSGFALGAGGAGEEGERGDDRQYGGEMENGPQRRCLCPCAEFHGGTSLKSRRHWPVVSELRKPLSADDAENGNFNTFIREGTRRFANIYNFLYPRRGALQFPSLLAVYGLQ